MLTLKNFILINDIKQVYISKNINFSNKVLLDDLNLNEYNDSNNNTLFFGLYEIEDYSKIYYHKGNKWLLFEGNDIDINSKYKSKLLEYTNDIKLNGFISFYNKLNENLQKLSIKLLIINPYD